MKRRYISMAIGVIIVMVITVFGNLLKINKVEVEFERTPVSVDVVEIYNFSTISLGDSILSLNENIVKKSIMDSYSDNSVAVTDIVRVFPNKVIIYCQEHIPMCAIAQKRDNNVYAIADGDFQLNKVVPRKEVNLDTLILIEGVEVVDTYNTEAFKTINKVFKALQNEGLDYSEQALFISKLTYSATQITITTRGGYEQKFGYTSETLSTEVHNFYQKYLLEANL